MARYNTIAPSVSNAVTGGISLPGVQPSLVTTFTGTAGTVTLDSPTINTGIPLYFYNGSSGTVSLASSDAVARFNSPGVATGTATINMPRYAFYTLLSDGTNYILANGFGGNFNANTAVIQSTLTTSGLTTFNLATNSSSSTNGGTLQVTGGMGVTQDVYIGGNTFLSGTGFLQLPVGGAVARPASPAVGMVRYNNDSSSAFIETYNGTSWVPIGTSWNYQTVTSNTTVAKWTWNWVKTASGAFTITLPASPNQGDTVKIVDVDINANSNNITVNGNGQNIQGSGSALTVSSNSAAFDLVYYNSTYGWRIIYV